MSFVKKMLIKQIRMGISPTKALRSLGFGTSSTAKQETQNKIANKYNESYSSQEFANNADAGSDFFNQTKQRGTLFGN